MPQLIIQGESRTGQGPAFESPSPWNRDSVGQVHAASVEQVNDAVWVARAAADSWRNSPVEARLLIARRFATLLKDNELSLARLISIEVGKPIWESKSEVQTAAAKIETSISAMQSRRFAFGDDHQRTDFVPLGLMVVLGPFNFPLHLPGSHLVPALLAGNTAVFKPSEHAPAVGEKLVQLWHAAGLPPGVLNLVHGNVLVAEALIDHLQVDGVLFTGSLQAGRAIHRRLAGRPEVMLALEMGGNNPLVVYQPSAIEAAVEIAIKSAFLSSGQRCTCARRMIVVDDSLGREFLRLFLKKTQALVVGLPSDEPEPFLGPLVSIQAAQHVLHFQEDLRQRGGKLLVAAEVSDRCPALVGPGVIDVTGLVGLPDAECFGPLLQLSWSDNFTAALKLANDTRFGLAAGLIGGDSSIFDRFQKTLRVGVMNWNLPTTGASGKLPFGGLGTSGNHRPSASFAADYCSDPVAIQKSASLEFTL